MRLPTRLPSQHPARKVIAAVVIAGALAGLALLARHAGPLRAATDPLENVAYDWLYRARTPRDMTGGDVVIVAVDDNALKDADEKELFGDRFGWPWPRETWSALIPYLQRHGARAVVFDLLFEQTSVYNRVQPDDKSLAEAARAAKVPVIFASVVSPEGRPGPFAPAAAPARFTPVFGASNYGGGAVVREYDPVIHGKPSLALRAASAAGDDLSTPSAGPFRLHYYGPSRLPGGRYTFPYLSAGRVVASALDSATTAGRPRKTRRRPRAIPGEDRPRSARSRPPCTTSRARPVAANPWRRDSSHRGRKPPARPAGPARRRVDDGVGHVRLSPCWRRSASCCRGGRG